MNVQEARFHDAVAEQTGETFIVQGGTVQRVQSWSNAEKIDKGDRWTVAELAAEAPKLAKPPKS